MFTGNIDIYSFDHIIDSKAYLLKLWTYSLRQVLRRSTFSTGTLTFCEIYLGAEGCRPHVSVLSACSITLCFSQVFFLTFQAFKTFSRSRSTPTLRRCPSRSTQSGTAKSRTRSSTAGGPWSPPTGCWPRRIASLSTWCFYGPKLSLWLLILFRLICVSMTVQDLHRRRWENRDDLPRSEIELAIYCLQTALVAESTEHLQCLKQRLQGYERIKKQGYGWEKEDTCILYRAITF